MIKLVLFIDNIETYESFDYPLQGNEDLDPRPTYVSMNGLDKSLEYPELDDFTHEWKILYKEDPTIL